MPELDEPDTETGQRLEEEIRIREDEIDRLEEKIDYELHEMEVRIRDLERFYQSLIPLSITTITGLFGLQYGLVNDFLSIIIGSIGLLIITLYFGWTESRRNS